MKTMKYLKLIATACVVGALCVFGLAACGGSSDSGSTDGTTSSESNSAETSSEQAEGSDTERDAAAATADVLVVGDDGYATKAKGEYAEGKHVAEVKVKGYKAFQIELDADAAPVTVANFCALAQSGYYDGLTFHRIVEDFCLQGGDPTGTGSGGDDATCIVGEFSDNDVKNKLADNFEEGVVAMARTSEMNSASTQWFVTLSSSKSVSMSLNGQYAAFGTIDADGMKVVNGIVSDYASKASGTSGTITNVSDQPVIESITITK